MINTDEAVKRFDEDGFVHLEGLWDAAEVDLWSERLDRFIAQIVPTLPRASAMYDDYDDPSTLKHISRLDSHDPEFKALLHDSRILDLAKALLRDEVVPQQIEAFIKAPQQGTPTPSHQDGYYFCLTPNEAVTFWLPIGDIDALNGALSYFKGSHRDGLQAHGASGVTGFSQGLAQGDNNREEVVCAVKKGDCLVHHSLTVHRADGNRSDRPRRALGLVFYAARAQPDEAAQQRYDESLRAQQQATGVL